MPTTISPRNSWPISLDIIQNKLATANPTYRESLIKAFTHCIAHQISLPAFADAVGYDPSTILKILRADYRDPRSGDLYDIPKKLHDAITTWLRTQATTSQPLPSDFITTPTAKKIWQHCDLARESRTPVFLYGASHLGKTWALQRYAHDHNHGQTILVRVPTAAGLLGLVRAIAAALTIPTHGTSSHLIERIKNALTPQMVLILDEVHQLIYTYRKEAFFACLEVLRSIHDHVGCGMVLCTTDVFRHKIEHQYKETLQQLLNRGVHRLELGSTILAADLRAILAHHCLLWPKKSDRITVGPYNESPHEIIHTLAKHHGLKSITERIRYGKKIAATQKATAEWEHFISAHLIIQNNSLPPANDWTSTP